MKSLTNNGKTKKQSPNKRKEGSLRKTLNEKQASQLSDNEFKELVIKKFNELPQN